MPDPARMTVAEARQRAETFARTVHALPHDIHPEPSDIRLWSSAARAAFRRHLRLAGLYTRHRRDRVSAIPTWVWATTPQPEVGS